MATINSSVTLPDGRELEYLTAGPDDGETLLLHVGTPNAATAFRAITEPASALGLRTVCYSRPGYGASTAQPGRTVADAVPDSLAVLDALGCDEFLTLGWSGGGPHALACAALAPERCRGAAVLAGLAPYPARGIDFLSGMDQANVAEFLAAIGGIDSLTTLMTRMAPAFSSITAGAIVDDMSGLLSGVDAQSLQGEFAEDMANALRRSVEAGIEGWRDDDLAFVRPWGFDLVDIGVPVAIWHGKQDRMVPFAHGQWLAAEIALAEAHLFADEGHLSLVSQIDRILADLVAQRTN